jgi:hypothetical protein
MKKKLPQIDLVEKSYASYSKPSGMCKNASVSKPCICWSAARPRRAWRSLSSWWLRLSLGIQPMTYARSQRSLTSSRLLPQLMYSTHKEAVSARSLALGAILPSRLSEWQVSRPQAFGPFELGVRRTGKDREIVSGQGF